VIDFDQFVYDDDEIRVDVRVELPMHVAADNLIISDTTEFSFAFNPEKFEALSATINSRLENFFPLELNFQVYFLDGALNIVDSLFKEISVIDPATIGEDGRALDPMVTEIQVEIEREQLEDLKKTAFVVPVIRLLTKDEQFVKLFSDYKLHLKMTAEIVTDVHLNP